MHVHVQRARVRVYFFCVFLFSHITMSELEKIALAWTRELAATMQEERKTDPRRPRGPSPTLEETETPGVYTLVGNTPEWTAYTAVVAKEAHERRWAKGTPMDTWRNAAYASAMAAKARGDPLTLRQSNAIADHVEAQA